MSAHQSNLLTTISSGLFQSVVNFRDATLNLRSVLHLTVVALLLEKWFSPYYISSCEISPQMITLTWILIFLLIIIGLTPGGNSTVHIYTPAVRRTTQRLWLEDFLVFEPKAVKLKLTMN
jgi:hypothetical protein